MAAEHGGRKEKEKKRPTEPKKKSEGRRRGELNGLKMRNIMVEEIYARESEKEG